MSFPATEVTNPQSLEGEIVLSGVGDGSPATRVEAGAGSVNSVGQGLGARTQVPQVSQSQLVVERKPILDIRKNNGGSDFDSASGDVNDAGSWRESLAAAVEGYTS